MATVPGSTGRPKPRFEFSHEVSPSEATSSLIAVPGVLLATARRKRPEVDGLKVCDI
jgi:hypothetical protein